MLLRLQFDLPVLLHQPAHNFLLVKYLLGAYGKEVMSEIVKNEHRNLYKSYF
jgi:hypothetical protein